MIDTLIIITVFWVVGRIYSFLASLNIIHLVLVSREK
jgi:hypothetical protein